MTTQTEQHQAGIEASSEWRAAADAILGGIRHDLNGRIGVISGIAQLTRMDGALDAELSGTLTGEVERLERLSELIGLIAGERTPREELVHLSTVVTDAVDLVQRHRKIDGVSIEPSTGGDGTVLVQRSRLVKAIVVLLVAVVRSGERRIRIETASDGGVAQILIQGAGGAAGTAAGQDTSEAATPTLPEDALEAARSGVAACGGVVERLDAAGAVGLRVRLPIDAG